jgi:hypothetical protein
MTVSERDNIVAQNKKHVEALFSEYQPTTGVGSPIERVRLTLSRDGRHILIPKYIATASAFTAMLDYPSVEDYIEDKGYNKDQIYDIIT